MAQTHFRRRKKAQCQVSEINIAAAAATLPESNKKLHKKPRLAVCIVLFMCDMCQYPRSPNHNHVNSIGSALAAPNEFQMHEIKVIANLRREKSSTNWNGCKMVRLAFGTRWNVFSECFPICISAFLLVAQIKCTNAAATNKDLLATVHCAAAD